MKFSVFVSLLYEIEIVHTVRHNIEKYATPHDPDRSHHTVLPRTSNIIRHLLSAADSLRKRERAFDIRALVLTSR